MMDEIQKQVQRIQSSAINDPRFKQHEEIEITKEAVDSVDTIFKSMLPHFPAWRQTCPTDEDLGRLKAAWTKAIIRHSRKIGRNTNFKAGIVACEESDSDWLPSVGKFIKWCDQTGDVELLAQRALDLFNSRQKQIDSVGQMVVSKHAFDLKRLNASETKKQFINLYLTYAEDTAINPLDGFAVEDMSTCSYEERKRATERENRSDEENKALDDAAQGAFFKQFKSIRESKPIAQPKNATNGVKTGTTGRKAQTQKQADENRERQLKAIKGKL